MRDLDRRMKKLEEQRAHDCQPEPMTLADFYAAIGDPEHPDHDGIKRTFSHFYADLSGDRPYDAKAFLLDCEDVKRARAARLAAAKLEWI